MNDLNVGTVRTALPVAWTAGLVELIRRVTGVQITPTEALGVLAVAGPVVYRIGRELERRWPAIGRILFGSTKTPTY